MFGHVEDYEDRLQHMIVVRELQRHYEWFYGVYSMDFPAAKYRTRGKP